MTGVTRPFIKSRAKRILNGCLTSYALLIVDSHLCRRAAHLDLRAHFLEARTRVFKRRLFLLEPNPLWSPTSRLANVSSDAKQRDNFVHRQRMSFSLGADALSYDARQVAARLDVVRESYDRRES